MSIYEEYRNFVETTTCKKVKKDVLTDFLATFSHYLVDDKKDLRMQKLRKAIFEDKKTQPSVMDMSLKANILNALGFIPKISTEDRNYNVLHGLLGLVNETKELARQVALCNCSPYPNHLYMDELGDVLWFYVRLLNSLGITLEEVMTFNMKKLKERNRQ